MVVTACLPNISDTETSSAGTETFNRALRRNLMRTTIHTPTGVSLLLKHVQRLLRPPKNCIHSMSHPGHPWENSPIERWWIDFKLNLINKHPRPKTPAELEQPVKGAIEYS